MSRPARLLAALLTLTSIALPAGAFAQATAPDAPPSYAQPGTGAAAGETITGRISSFDGAYSLQLHDDRGFIDNVQLRQGTIINPTGLRLEPGMTVTIHGVNSGAFFSAVEIDTPYQSFVADPIYPYGPYVYPYPAYPYPYPVYAYPYGPSLSVGIGFGPVYHRGFWR